MRGTENAIFIIAAATAVATQAARHLAVLRGLDPSQVERAGALGFLSGVLVGVVLVALQ